MKTQNSFIATVIVITILVTALFTSFTASANVYEDRLKEAFDDIVGAVSIEVSQMHTIYSDPETGVKEGQLDVIKFTLGPESMDLLNNAKRVYEQVNGNSTADIYTLWWNDNDDGIFQGYRLYYSPENAITVGLACDHCYTVGFIPPSDTKHRNTYTIEWNDASAGDSITGRLITTYAPVKAKATDGHRIISTMVINTDEYDKYMEQFQAGMEKYQEGMEKYNATMEQLQGTFSGLSDGQGHSFSFSSTSSSSSKNYSNSWMKKLLFYVDKVQQSRDRYLYLSKLYELCKDTDGLDQTDLKIGMRQLASVYKQLKAKNKLKENELLFLESMVDLLESKIQK